MVAAAAFRQGDRALLLDDVAVEASAAELNGLVGVTATAAELNRATDVSGRIVNATAATLTVTEALHEGRVVTLNRAGGIAVTLPAATGGGGRYRFIVGTSFTTPGTIKVVGNDVMTGLALIAMDGGDTTSLFATAVDSDTLTLDGSTTGGLAGADVELIDIAADLWWVNVRSDASGSEASPFSATV